MLESNYEIFWMRTFKNYHNASLSSYYVLQEHETQLQSNLSAPFFAGHAFYDWFIGRELNPRIGPIDVKYVIFRSGIIGWMLLNFANLILAFAESKISVSPNLVLLEVIQFFYVLDYFWLEEGILMSRDIVHEGLGFNIAMQFLMIPFSFCTQSRYVTTTGYSSSWIMLLIIFTIYGKLILN